MKYALAVHTARGETLVFPHYGKTEYLLAVAIARFQSGSSCWAEVREVADGSVRARYVAGSLAPGQPASVYSDDFLSHHRQRHGITPGEREDLRRVLVREYGDEWP